MGTFSSFASAATLGKLQRTQKLQLYSKLSQTELLKEYLVFSYWLLGGWNF